MPRIPGPMLSTVRVMFGGFAILTVVPTLRRRSGTCSVSCWRNCIVVCLAFKWFVCVCSQTRLGPGPPQRGVASARGGFPCLHKRSWGSQRAFFARWGGEARKIRVSLVGARGSHALSAFVVACSSGRYGVSPLGWEVSKRAPVGSSPALAGS